MAVLTVQQVVSSGLTYAVASLSTTPGDTFKNSKPTLVHLENTTGSPINVTVETPGTVEGLAIADRVIAVPANDDVVASFVPSRYNDGDGNVTIYAASAGINIAILKL